MNIKKPIIWFAVWGTVILLFKWFYSEINQLLTPFLLIIPLGGLLIWSIIFGMSAIRIVVENFNQDHIKSIIPLFIFLVVISLYFFTSFEVPKVKLEYMLYTNKRQEMVLAIQNGELTDDGIGNIELPYGYKHISCDGEAYVYQNDEQGTVIGFWSFRGLLMNPYESVIYTTYDEPPTFSTLGCVKIYTIQKLDEYWYYVMAY